MASRAKAPQSFWNITLIGRYGCRKRMASKTTCDVSFTNRRGVSKAVSFPRLFLTCETNLSQPFIRIQRPKKRLRDKLNDLRQTVLTTRRHMMWNWTVATIVAGLRTAINWASSILALIKLNEIFGCNFWKAAMERGM